jgi:hypothetical protein
MFQPHSRWSVFPALRNPNRLLKFALTSSAYAHADPERPGAGRVSHPHDVSNDPTPRGLRVDRTRTQFDRAVESTRRVGAGKSAGDAGRTGDISDKCTARLAAHALYHPEIGPMLAAYDEPGPSRVCCSGRGMAQLGHQKAVGHGWPLMG